jgi:hypothetical protein
MKPIRFAVIDHFDIPLEVCKICGKDGWGYEMRHAFSFLQRKQKGPIRALNLSKSPCVSSRGLTQIGFEHFASGSVFESAQSFLFDLPYTFPRKIKSFSYFFQRKRV